MDDTGSIRLKLAEIINRAETDTEFRSRLAANTSSVLAENGIPANAVDDFSAAISKARRGGDLAADRSLCIHTDGCQDFTCFSSSCPNTCFVSIVIDAPDA